MYAFTIRIGSGRGPGTTWVGHREVGPDRELPGVTHRLGRCSEEAAGEVLGAAGECVTQPLDEVIKISSEDVWQGKGAFSRLAVGTKLTRGDLLRLALMASENRAAHVLARTYPGGKAAFVKTMNLKAKALGMTQTRYADASGLSNLNVSNARDLAKLVIAVSRDSRIREFSTLHSHEVRLGRNMFQYRNTNLLVGRPEWEILVQKTGYTNDAGQCLVMEATIEERPVVMVLLNSFGSLTRTADARRIRKWMEAQQGSRVAGASEMATK